jgi:hypothetical protein
MMTTRSIACNFSSANVSEMQLNGLQEPPEIMKQTTKKLYDNAAEVARHLTYRTDQAAKVDVANRAYIELFEKLLTQVLRVQRQHFKSQASALQHLDERVSELEGDVSTLTNELEAMIVKNERLNRFNEFMILRPGATQLSSTGLPPCHMTSMLIPCMARRQPAFCECEPAGLAPPRCGGGRRRKTRTEEARANIATANPASRAARPAVISRAGMGREKAVGLVVKRAPAVDQRGNVRALTVRSALGSSGEE